MSFVNSSHTQSLSFASSSPTHYISLSENRLMHPTAVMCSLQPGACICLSYSSWTITLSFPEVQQSHKVTGVFDCISPTKSSGWLLSPLASLSFCKGACPHTGRGETNNLLWACSIPTRQTGKVCSAWSGGKLKGKTCPRKGQWTGKRLPCLRQPRQARWERQQQLPMLHNTASNQHTPWGEAGDRPHLD